MPFEQQLIVEGIRAAVAVLALLLTWRFGQPIIARWDMRKKRRELDLALSNDFQRLFGEYKEIWRLWKAHYEATKPTSKQTIGAAAVDTTRWELFARAAAAEGRVEAVFMKLAVDRPLSSRDLQMLGYFRQAFQILRQGIRDGEHLNYSNNDPRYQLFIVLGCWVAYIINRDSHALPPSADKVQKNLVTIQSYRSDEWEEAVVAWSQGTPLPMNTSATRILDESAVPVPAQKP